MLTYFHRLPPSKKGYKNFAQNMTTGPQLSSKYLEFFEAPGHARTQIQNNPRNSVNFLYWPQLVASAILKKGALDAHPNPSQTKHPIRCSPSGTASSLFCCCLGLRKVSFFP
jgi:hypothetical protein